MIANPDQWQYVRQNADGFYVNFIQMLNPDPKKCAQMCALFTHKNAYYESDSRYTGLGGFPDGGQFSRALERQELGALLNGGFQVPYSSLNYGVDDAKLADLKSYGMPAAVSRPCFTQCGPWTLGGDITNNTASSVGVRANVVKTDGLSTDGPLSLWAANTGQMQSGSYSCVKYAHSLNKTAIVMVAPYNLQPVSLWLTTAQGCVRQHENAGAKPDIWDVFEYATTTPTLPETTTDGQPADTITGMAYWLIHHIKDPQNYARLTPSTTAANSSGTRRVVTMTLHNHSTWLDLCPVLFARTRGLSSDWTLHLRVNGQDVTRQMTQAGLPFIGSLRLWPGNTRQVQVILDCKSAAIARNTPSPTIEIGLRSHPSVTRTAQMVTLRPFLPRLMDRVAIRP